jgi:hypothetical protein
VTEPNRGLSEPSEILGLYRLAVEMADRVSARRASANSFFFTIQAGLAVALGAFGVRGDVNPTTEPDRFILTLAAVAGMLIAGSWWLLLRSYRDLNTAKFAVIGRIEAEHLPVQLFKEEWEELKRDPVKRWRPRYAEQGQAERVVPLVFLGIYGVLALYVTFG